MYYLTYLLLFVLFSFSSSFLLLLLLLFLLLLLLFLSSVSRRCIRLVQSYTHLSKQSFIPSKTSLSIIITRDIMSPLSLPPPPHLSLFSTGKSLFAIKRLWKCHQLHQVSSKALLYLYKYCAYNIVHVYFVLCTNRVASKLDTGVGGSHAQKALVYSFLGDHEKVHMYSLYTVIASIPPLPLFLCKGSFNAAW